MLICGDISILENSASYAATHKKKIYVQRIFEKFED